MKPCSVLSFVLFAGCTVAAEPDDAADDVITTGAAADPVGSTAPSDMTVGHTTSRDGTDSGVAEVSTSEGSTGTPQEALLSWFPDCDGDGWAGSSRPVESVERPADRPGACLGVQGVTWTTRVPVPGGFDCDDTDATVRPDQRDWFVEPRPGLEPGDEGAFDYDCNGYTEVEIDAYHCVLAPGPGGVNDVVCNSQSGMVEETSCGELGLEGSGCEIADACGFAATKERRQRCR